MTSYIFFHYLTSILHQKMEKYKKIKKIKKKKEIFSKRVYLYVCIHVGKIRNFINSKKAYILYY